MRENYVDVIKQYIVQKPQYKQTLDQIKADVLMMGGTEEEFEHAIQQIEEEQNRLGKLKDKISKKHILYGISGFVFAIFYVVFIYNLLFPQTQTTTIATKAPAKEDQKLFPVVYANSKEVDADKVFSIPATGASKLNVYGKPQKEIMGFFPYWMIDKENQINVSYLTSATIFGLTVNGRGEISKIDGDSPDQGWEMWKDSRLDDFIAKAKRSKVKVFLTFKSFNNNDIESLTKNSSYQQSFITNAMFLVNSKNLDGINLDFEYVGNPPKTAREGFSKLVTNLNAELKRQIPNSSLSIDTYLTSGQNEDLFDLTSLSNGSDYFIVMGYDIHTPLGSAGSVSAMGGEQNIVAFIENYLQKVDAQKIILAVPYYGYDWPLQTDSENTSVKILPYAEIADSSRSLRINWDETSETPFYNYKEDGINRVVHFDNVRSLGIKYDFINQKGLAGVGIWALGYDGLNQDLQKLIIDKFITQ